MKNKKNKWVRPRHKFFTELLRPLFVIFLFFKYGYKIKKSKVNNNQNYLIISNHAATLDPFMLGLSFPFPIYSVASEDLLKNKIVSKILSYALAPIPIKKGITDLVCIKRCISISKEGGSIAIFPEGNRTYSGELLKLDISIVKLIRLLKIPLILYHIEGGYGIDPRWGNKGRKSNGSYGTIRKILSLEEINSLSDDELLSIVEHEISYKEENNIIYKSSRKAEYLERILFVCPSCSSLETITSNKNSFKCTNCSLEGYYSESLKLTFNNKNIKFNNIADWMNFQRDFVRKLEIKENLILLSDDKVELIYVPTNSNKQKINYGKLNMYNDRFELIGKTKNIFYFKDISEVVNQGKHKVLFYIGNEYYQFKGLPRFSSYKYYLMFQKIQNKYERLL